MLYMKTLILILFSLSTVVLSAQSLSLQRVFVGEYDYQNVPESISFTSYKFQYKFQKPFFVHLTSESARYWDSFENRFDYAYLGIGIGAYTKLYKGLSLDFGYGIQTALKREFEPNPLVNLVQNHGSQSDIEKVRHLLFGNLNYEQEIYKALCLSVGVGIESVLNPYSNSESYGYNDQTNQVNHTGAYASGISRMYVFSIGITYKLN